MADLTPPSSNNNTPQRSLQPDEDESPSPTRQHHTTTAFAGDRLPHPLATSTSHAMDLDSVDAQGRASSTPSDSGNSQDEGTAQAEGVLIEDEDSDEGMGMDMEPASDSGDDEHVGTGKIDQAGAGSGAQAGLVETGLNLLSKLDPRTSSKIGQKRSKYDSKRRSNHARGAFSTPGGQSAGAKKDNDLYESDIVERWNRDFGDVCAEAKTSKPTTGSTTAPEAAVPIEPSPITA
ncbi:hypothetical protein IAR55_001484 [Kwoniella newhampshirensis]|uniref:Btz domain-containing protein n=1 Tax=Kwoniella newhampshirensis TaxID=1651941 RepID=A0AAW0Z2A6_9TREE